MLKQAVKVAKYFKNSNLRTGLLNNAAAAQGKPQIALQLLSKTRWQGKLNCINSLINNKDNIEAALAN